MSEHPIERWVYAGRRLTQKDKLVHAWIDPDGRELWYVRVVGHSIGALYDVEAERADKNVAVYDKPSFVNSETSDELNLDEWRAEDRAASALLEARRVEKRAMQDDELEEALEVLRRHYDKLHTMAKRGAFLSYVTGEITRPPKDES